MELLGVASSSRTPERPRSPVMWVIVKGSEVPQEQDAFASDLFRVLGLSKHSMFLALLPGSLVSSREASLLT